MFVLLTRPLYGSNEVDICWGSTSWDFVGDGYGFNSYIFLTSGDLMTNDLGRF